MINIILISVITVFIFMMIMFTIAQLIKNNSIVDIGWGIGFVLIAAALFFTEERIDTKDIILSIMILFWGVRLATHILLRASGKPEDFRYAQWRKDWGDKAVINAFLKVFMLQGILMLLIAYPIMVVFYSYDASIGLISYTGLAIFVIGFLFESVGDYQMTAFKKDPANKGKIITSGVWKYSRHPNYFGEAFLWWGIWIFTIGSELYLTALFSPLLINFLLVKVSGVPMLEKKYEGRDDWEAYKKITPTFIPFVGRKG